MLLVTITQVYSLYHNQYANKPIFISCALFGFDNTCLLSEERKHTKHTYKCSFITLYLLQSVDFNQRVQFYSSLYSEGLLIFHAH